MCFFLVLLIFFLYKFYLYTYLYLPLMVIYWLETQILFYSKCSWVLFLFSDTLVLLSILISLICWVILGERFLFLSFLNVGYFLVFILFTINMVYTQNLFSMFLFFEFIFLPSLYFVYTSGYAKRVDKSIKFLLLWTFFGSLIVFLSLLYLYSIDLSLQIDLVLDIIFTEEEVWLLSLSFFLGFGVKLPIWPFHYWLTKVHVEAPAGFSIFLSGFLVKTALYCLYFFYTLFCTTVVKYFMLGIVSWGIFDSSCRMWAVIDIKRLIAFATIQEMNLIYLCLLLSSNTSYLLINLFILVHGLLSALFFFLVDQIQKRLYTRNIFSIGGLGVKLTFLPILLWIALLIFRGFPLFIKFFIEWEILVLLLENFLLVGIFFFFIINSFAVLGFSRIIFILLYGVPKVQTIFWVDLLKKDFLIGSILIILLGVLSFGIFLF